MVTTHDVLDVVTANSEDGLALPEQVRAQGRLQIKNSTFLNSSVVGLNLGSGDPVKSAVILQIKGGKFVYVTNAKP